MRIAVPMLVPANWRGGLVSLEFSFFFCFLFSLPHFCVRERKREREREREINLRCTKQPIQKPYHR